MIKDLQCLRYFRDGKDPDKSYKDQVSFKVIEEIFMKEHYL